MTVYPTNAEVSLECDLVMKGGITSGVVYPLALCELAKTYRFKSIGGSSAGAIAATLAAAAEYGRDGGGFTRLAAIPSEIGPALPKLFKPGARTRTAHALLMNAVDPAATWRLTVGRSLRTLVAAQARAFAAATAVAFAFGLGVAVLTAGIPATAFDIAQLAVLVVVFATLAVAGGLVYATVREAKATWLGLSHQGFGICVGSGGGAADPGAGADPGDLTDWLADRIDELAGVTGPLTFGDLTARGIRLQVMTTNLTNGRPMTFPFTGRVFLFDPEELGRWFPARVVDRLVGDQRPATEHGDVLCGPEGRELYRFPAASEIPVVLAARFSLSFPGLISAVPLYAVDYSRAKAADRRPVRCWFSDGGITSNFPIHFFDRLLPRRPTFGLDLRPYHADRPGSDVYYAGSEPRQTRFRSIADPVAFVKAILDTMQYWSDDAQAALPGYRDRVVEVHLHDDEGGMNLRMPAPVIDRLAEKGRLAAERLARAFDFPQHRWTRYLIAMNELQEVVGQMNEVFDGPYQQSLFAAAPSMHLYSRSVRWTAAASTRTQELLRFGAATDPDFSKQAPKPRPTLRLVPRF